MNDKLINRIEKKGQKKLYYNTACLIVTQGNEFNKVYGELLDFVKCTIKEEGCIEFFAAPSSIDKKEIMLWEVWENEEYLQIHMNAEHTKNILGKNLVQLKWSESTIWSK